MQSTTIWTNEEARETYESLGALADEILTSAILMRSVYCQGLRAWAPVIKAINKRRADLISTYAAPAIIIEINDALNGEWPR